jgi:phosphoglycolate phosphatase
LQLYDVTDSYEALVFDLDGTLLELPVDWDDVRREVAAVLRVRGVDVEDKSLWTLLEAGESAGFRDRIEAVIADAEREAARRATRLATADALPLDIPVGVCSLNCEAACRLALELHGLDGHVGAVVGRDSVGVYKPDPEPLLETVRFLDADPRRTLFVGDTDRDAETAERAGVDFRFVRDWTGP